MLLALLHGAGGSGGLEGMVIFELESLTCGLVWSERSVKILSRIRPGWVDSSRWGIIELNWLSVALGGTFLLSSTADAVEVNRGGITGCSVEG